MLPRIKVKQLTPGKPAVRSNTKLPSSSDRRSSSLCSVKSTQRPAPHLAETTISKNISTGEASSDSEPYLGPIPIPILKRKREDFTRSPSLPPNRPTPIPDTTTTAFCNTEFSSSQTNSTFPGSELASSVSDDELSDGDHPEMM